MPNAEVPSLKDFRSAFCARFDCSLEEFETKVFWRCIFPHAIPIAWMILRLDTGFFDHDFRTIRQLATASSIGDFVAEVKSFRSGYRKRSKFLREVMRVRVSGKRLLKLARQTLP